MGEKDIDYDEYKLGEVIKMKCGNVNSSDITNTGEYPFYNAGLNNPIGTHNNYSFDGDEYLIFIKSGGNAQNKISDKHALGYNYLVKGKIACNVAVYKLELEKNIMSYKYLHYYLLCIKHIIQEEARYTTGNGNVNMDHLRNIKIKILKPEIIKQYGLDKDFEFVEELKNNINNTLNIQKEALNKLMQLVLTYGVDKNEEKIDEKPVKKVKSKQTKKVESSSDNESETDKSSESEEEKIKEDLKPKKKDKTKTKKIESDSSSESEKEYVKPIKKIKSKQTKKVESSSESESESNSSSSSEIEDIKSKKILSKKKNK